MVYNYHVLPGEDFNIKTPSTNSLNDVNTLLKANGDIVINKSIYPTGFEITMTQLANRINITTNMELIKCDDGYYHIKELDPNI